MNYRTASREVDRAAQVDLGAAARLSPGSSTTPARRAHRRPRPVLHGPARRHAAGGRLHRPVRRQRAPARQRRRPGRSSSATLIDAADARAAYWSSSAFLLDLRRLGRLVRPRPAAAGRRVRLRLPGAGAAGQPVRATGHVDHTTLDYTVDAEVHRDNWDLKPLAGGTRRRRSLDAFDFRPATAAGGHPQHRTRPPVAVETGPGPGVIYSYAAHWQPSWRRWSASRRSGGGDGRDPAIARSAPPVAACAARSLTVRRCYSHRRTWRWPAPATPGRRCTCRRCRRCPVSVVAVDGTVGQVRCQGPDPTSPSALHSTCGSAPPSCRQTRISSDRGWYVRPLPRQRRLPAWRGKGYRVGCSYRPTVFLELRRPLRRHRRPRTGSPRCGSQHNSANHDLSGAGARAALGCSDEPHRAVGSPRTGVAPPRRVAQRDGDGTNVVNRRDQRFSAVEPRRGRCTLLLFTYRVQGADMFFGSGRRPRHRRSTAPTATTTTPFGSGTAVTVPALPRATYTMHQVPARGLGTDHAVSDRRTIVLLVTGPPTSDRRSCDRRCSSPWALVLCRSTLRAAGRRRRRRC